MEERSTAPICERGNDLITFLYGEVDECEARNFERHLRSCAQCESEFGSFREIRESIVAWRQESLGAVPELVANSLEASPKSLEPTRPSALAAIRGFFDLSPLWMKGAVAFASILFCLVTGLAMARLFDKPEPAISSGEKVYTETELKARIEEALAKQRHLDGLKDEAPAVQVTNNNQRPLRRVGGRPGTLAADKTRRRPLTKSERAQLAADLRLISPDDEADFELLGDRINR